MVANQLHHWGLPVNFDPVWINPMDKTVLIHILLYNLIWPYLPTTHPSTNGDSFILLYFAVQTVLYYLTTGHSFSLQNTEVRAFYGLSIAIMYVRAIYSLWWSLSSMYVLQGYFICNHDFTLWINSWLNKWTNWIYV